MFKRRIFIFIFIGFCLCGLNAWAQSPQAPELEQTEAAAVEKAEKVQSTTPKEYEIDLDDPAIRDALDARDAADAALADAVRAQANRTPESLDGSVDGPAEAKPSIIPKSGDEVKALGKKIGQKVLGWLTSLAFLAQIGAIIVAYIFSPFLAKLLRQKVFLFKDPPDDSVKLKVARDYIYASRDLLRPILLVILLILFGKILAAIPMAGQTWLEKTWLVKIAQSLAVVFLLYKAINEFVSNDLVRKIAIWTIIPIALIMLFGYYDDLITRLDSISVMQMGGKPITLMTLILLIIFGALFFKLGNIANNKGQSAIRSQDGLDVATQEVVAKIFQIILFTIVTIMVLSAAKVPLSGLVVIFSALSLGVGLGLQPIAANFVSGMIILFDRSVRVGDFVVLPDGQEGFVEAINMRNTVVETTDGKDIMVPNTKFTEEAYENWTHKDPRQRYEVYFSVGYGTDLDKLEDIIIPEILKHPSVLKEPEMPDLELRKFGENGVDFAIEFWCDGIDDGPNKFTSDLNFVVWRTLRDNKIDMPLPQRVVRMT